MNESAIAAITDEVLSEVTGGTFDEDWAKAQQISLVYKKLYAKYGMDKVMDALKAHPELVQKAYEISSEELEQLLEGFIAEL